MILIKKMYILQHNCVDSVDSVEDLEVEEDYNKHI